jgi:hypothetical protein
MWRARACNRFTRHARLRDPSGPNIAGVHLFTLADPVRHVRFTPETGHPMRQSEFLLWAKSGHQRSLNQTGLLFEERLGT